MGDDVTTLRDETNAYDDGEVVTIRFLAVPTSARFPRGLKYAFHYGVAGAERPIIRFDNHHGPHELHLGAATFDIEFPGLESLEACFVAALPPEKRADW
ncbi:DUF6516 family protein [Salinirubellus sp. GCM10025818]|uniref:toxin-antitoxin system TumE family protein n=1 Tax=Salinirubellus TaxID=2162630 RepID=UPI0030CA9C0A